VQDTRFSIRQQSFSDIGTLPASSLDGVLMDLGDVGAAHAAIRKAREVVLARASLISDGRWRRSYLERNAENAAIVALAREWLSDA
jgi:hypothetical protein